VNAIIEVKQQRRRILNIAVDDITRDELLERFTQGLFLSPNVDCLMLLQENESFYRIYKSAQFVTVDSQIAFWAANWLGQSVREKVSGSDFLPVYCDYHRGNPNVRIFFLGGKDGVATKAAERINVRVGRHMVVGAHSPSMQFVDSPEECQAAVKMINRSGANVLVLGLGAPKQELWLEKYRHQMPVVHSFMAFGATLDFVAGTVKRAPKWMSRWGVEWLHRLLQEPRRLWRRYLVRDIGFFWLVLKQRLGLYRSPF
jgi:exopolysaccharide biosynthesis WecB/TagA/CpsF family protein